MGDVCLNYNVLHAFQNISHGVPGDTGARNSMSYLKCGTINKMVVGNDNLQRENVGGNRPKTIALCFIATVNRIQ